MEEKRMRRSLKFRDVLILAFSTMIGWGWVSLTGSWSVKGGVIGASLAFVIGAVLCIFVGMTYCELTPMLPYSGGELVFAYKAMGYHASWFTGWMITFAYVGVASWEGPALATAIDYLIPIPRFGYMYTVAGFEVYFSWLIIPTVVGAGLMLTNLKGIAISAKFQALVTIILALGGIGFAISSILKGNFANAAPLITSSRGVFSVLLAVPAMFVGFDVIPQAVEEMDLPIKKIPKAIILSISLAAAWYIIMIFSASVSAPREVLSGEGLTVVNAINYSTRRVLAGKLIIVTAIMGILSSWNGFIIGATRVLYSMGRAKMLPSVFGTLHTKYKSPYFTTLFIGLITILTPLLGKNSLEWFVNASSFGTVVAYLMVGLSFLILRIKEPNMSRPFKIRNGMIIGSVSVFISLFFITLYLPIGANSLTGIEWMIVLSWCLIGIFFYLLTLKNVDSNKEDRENSLLGG